MRTGNQIPKWEHVEKGWCEIMRHADWLQGCTFLCLEDICTEGSSSPHSGLISTTLTTTAYLYLTYTLSQFPHIFYCSVVSDPRKAKCSKDHQKELLSHTDEWITEQNTLAGLTPQKVTKFLSSLQIKSHQRRILPIVQWNPLFSSCCKHSTCSACFLSEVCYCEFLFSSLTGFDVFQSTEMRKSTLG